MKLFCIVSFLFLSAFTLNAETIAKEPKDTDGNGYRNINTLAHLRWFSENPLAWSEKFELDNDIDASETASWNICDHDRNSETPDSAMGWLPIGRIINYEMQYFSGEFDGHKHSIKNLYINRIDDNVGFFGFIDLCNIQRVNLENITVKGRNNVGGLWGNSKRDLRNERLVEFCEVSGKVIGDSVSGIFCGKSEYNMKIRNCKSSGELYSHAVGGGFCGISLGEIYDCNVLAKVRGGYSLGGFIGENYGLNHNSHVNIDIEGNRDVGGFCGGNNWYAYDQYEISACSSQGRVKGNTKVGGFCGTNLSKISESCTYCKVEGEKYVSGFIGYCYHWGPSTVVRNCYSRGSVKGKERVAGFISFTAVQSGSTSDAGRVINKCYSTGLVLAEKDSAGFVDYNWDFSIDDCYYDRESSNIETAQWGNAKTTYEMKNWATFKGWDFVDVWAIDPNINDGYPYFKNHLVGVEDDIDDDENIVVYPNPSNAILNIKLNSDFETELSIELIDLSGHTFTLFKGISNDIFSFDISKFSRGRYFVKIIQDQKKYSVPIIFE